MAATPAYQTPTMPSQFPIRNPSASPASPHTRRSSDAMRGGSSEGMRSGSNAGPPHHMVGNTLFEDAATLKGDHSDSTLKGDHSGLDSPYAGYPADDGTSSHHIHKLERVTSTLQGPRKWMGLKPTAPLAGDEDHAAHAHLGWSKTKIVFKEPFAEFWGTFILVLFGNAGLAQVTLGQANGTGPGGVGFGDWQSVNWAFGIGLMLGIYVAGDSGAYLNPAVTLASCVLRKLPWRRLPMYLIAQTLGGFAAAGVVYANYYSLIHAYDPGLTVAPSPTATAGIFATYPGEGVSKVNQFFDQFIASALLVFMIFALKDDSNKGQFVASGAWFPLALFFLMFGISACFGIQTGFAINFARDAGPRLMTYALGYGHEVWSAGGYYFWIPMVAPFIGCLTGGVLYDIFIYTGESPINTPWFGLAKLFNPKRTLTERLESQKESGLV